ncbi:hypothetical protein M128_4616 [Bacteroides fragilis str. S6L8]|jgi:hypothetical protein|uniref:Uncharacterized protein n=3 Tax=Bacteroides fragilis TaxID=817 RepID=A0A015UYF3_BACFG|nr:hypothetical protein M118_4052 [Bacteroides fragilis str. 3783N1-2]EXY49192.1 hypothetical protein M121_4018 [Bacteroides fragilis str. 3783N2-1]EXY54017.1 hypothetical protein M122_3975 [Bacteroides fragilis str. 3976T7]EXY82309.1 hypothetical protein M079_4571 [Bacteroides fragilis str. 3996 N(B) 6]EXY88026.1 hypothetical protein M125_5351 [Bacteroides fragilis str. 3998T(B)3]EXY93420.1 hypothetical protein M081_4511 [Bacteroides fragilis str. 3998 T(B) 4]EXY98474.1 hypothetical protein 
MLQEKKRAERQLSAVKSRAPGVKEPCFSEKEASIYSERSKHLPGKK